MIYIDKEEIVDLLYDCGIMEVETANGRIFMVDVDEVMDDFIPQVITYINEKLDSEKIICE